MDNQVQVIDRTFDILEYLSATRSPAGPTEIADATRLHKSTVYRLLSAMKKRGYIEKQDNGYVLGVKLIAMSSRHINSLELQAEARPLLKTLQADLQLIVHLGILDKDEVIYVEKIDVVPDMRLYAQIGLRVPAYCTSLGKCLLSGLSGDELDFVLHQCKWESYTPNTIHSLAKLRPVLREIRAQGWAIDNEEYIRGNRCVSAPIYDYRGEVIAAVSASGPVTILSDDRIANVAAKVQATAKEISHRLCYQE